MVITGEDKAQNLSRGQNYDGTEIVENGQILVDYFWWRTSLTIVSFGPFSF